MYNEELKKRFISEYTQSMYTAKVATTIFSALEEYENEWGSDLCTQSAETLQPVINEITGLRSRSQSTSLTVLREYVKWCITMKIPGACDGMLHIKAVGLDKIKKQMVSSPLHLQKYLNDIFEPENEETVDVIYRCYYWMAFSGIKEDDTLLVKAADIDLQNMQIHYAGIDYPIYREAIPAFRAAIELKSFCYKHPNYTKLIRKERVPGDTIMRGIRAVTKTMTIRVTLSQRSSDAIKAGKTDLHLSFYRIWMSGLFYRTYENERAGLPVNFSDVASDFMSGKEYTINGVNQRIKVSHKQNRIEKNYMEDYERWKLAFSI